MKDLKFIDDLAIQVRAALYALANRDNADFNSSYQGLLVWFAESYAVCNYRALGTILGSSRGEYAGLTLVDACAEMLDTHFKIIGAGSAE